MVDYLMNNLSEVMNHIYKRSSNFIFLQGDVNSGVSYFSTFLGCKYLESGHNTLHIPLEGANGEALKRYVSVLSEISMASLLKNETSSQEKEKIKEISKLYEKKLIIKNMIQFGVQSNDVISFISTRGRQKEPTLVIIDYVQLMEAQSSLAFSFNNSEYKALIFSLDEIAKKNNLSFVLVNARYRGENINHGFHFNKERFLYELDGGKQQDSFSKILDDSLVVDISSKDIMGNKSIRVTTLNNYQTDNFNVTKDDYFAKIT